MQLAPSDDGIVACRQRQDDARVVLAARRAGRPSPGSASTATRADATRFWTAVMDALRGSGAVAAGDPLATLAPALGGQDGVPWRAWSRARAAAAPGPAGPRRPARAALGRGAARPRAPAHARAARRCASSSSAAATRSSACTACGSRASSRRSAPPTSSSPPRRPASCSRRRASRSAPRRRRPPARAHRGLGRRACGSPRCRSPATTTPSASWPSSPAASAPSPTTCCGEVLASQPPEVRRLLLRTCILERVTGPLADLLTGRSDGARLLHELEEANALVVAVDVARTWFRYHHLLADLLRLELRREAPDEVPRLHRLAAAWHAEHGHPIEAIRHAELAATGRSPPSCSAATGSTSCSTARRRRCARCSPACPRRDPDGRRGRGDRRRRPARRVALGGGRRAARRGAARDRRSCPPSARAPRPRWPPSAAARPAARRPRRRRWTRRRAAARRRRGRPRAELEALALMNLGIAESWTLRLADAEAHLERGSRSRRASAARTSRSAASPRSAPWRT